MSKRIRVVRIITRLILGGPTTHIALLKDGLSRSEYEQVLIYGTAEADEKTVLERIQKHFFSSFQIKELVPGIHLWKDLVSLVRVWRILRRFKPQIVHTHTSKAGAIGRVAAFLAGVPIRVHTIHGHIHNGYFTGIKYQTIRLIEKFLNKITTQLICVSEQVQKEYCDDHRMASRAKSCVIPLGLDFEEMVLKSREERQDLKTQFNLSEKSFLVGIVGRMIPVKNHAFLIRAADELLKKRKDFHFFILGDGQIRGECEMLARELKIESHIHFLGYQENTASFYPEFDVVVLTSINEGTPLTLIEAQGFSKPVVATNVGGVSETVLDDKTGLLVESGDESGFQDALIKLADDSTLRAQMGEAGFRYVKNNFSKKKLIGNMSQLYQKLLGKEV